MDLCDAPIALFLPDFPRGGVETVTARLASGLASLRPVQLVLASDVADEAEIPEGITVVRLGARRTVTALPALVQYLRTTRPKGLISSKDHASVVALVARAVARTHTRTLVVVHQPPQAAGPHRKGTGRTLPSLMRVFLPSARAVFAVSRGIAEGLIDDGIPASLVEVVSNPVITPGYTAISTPSGNAWLDQLEPEWPTVVWAGRMSPEKSVETLIRAFSSLVESRPARLVLVGDGEERPAIERLVSELGLADRVAFTGMVPDARPHLARASVVALSSRTEGLPTVLIEALAQGRQVVSTDCPTGPAELLDGGRLGRLVPVGDHEALAQALQLAIEAPLPGASSADLAQYRSEDVAIRYAVAVGALSRDAWPVLRGEHTMSVTLAILCHNRREELARAVASARACGFVEILILDNGSDPPIPPIDGTGWTRVEKNIGVAAGRNLLAEMASGELIFFLDDDATICTDDAAARLARLFRQDPALGAVACRIERTNRKVVPSEYPFRGSPHAARTERPCAYFVGAAHAVRRAAWREVGGLDESFQYSTEEIDLAMALLARGYRCWYSPDIVVEHRPSPRGRREPPEIPAMRLRNRIVYARRHLPRPVATVHVAVWAAKTFREAVATASPRPWWAACRSGLREPVRRETLSWPMLLVAHNRGGRVFW